MKRRQGKIGKEGEMVWKSAGDSVEDGGMWGKGEGWVGEEGTKEG